MREKTDFLNKPTSQKLIIKIGPPIYTFMLFLDALAQEKYVKEVSLLEVLYAFLQF